MPASLTEVAHRRRGDELINAILEATLAELCERGLTALTIESVAERAGVGKASIYRRWPGKSELVLDALEGVLSAAVKEPDTGRIRDDLLALLGGLTQVFNGPCGAIARHSPPEQDAFDAALKEQLVGPRREMMQRVLRRAIERGEIRPDAADNPWTVDAGPFLLHAAFLRDGRVTKRDVAQIVDEVLVPMLRP